VSQTMMMKMMMIVVVVVVAAAAVVVHVVSVLRKDRVQCVRNDAC